MNEIEKFNIWLKENHSSFEIPDRIIEEYCTNSWNEFFEKHRNKSKPDQNWADRNCDCNGNTISDADPGL